MMLMENAAIDIKKGGGEVFDKVHILCRTKRNNLYLKRKQGRTFLKLSFHFGLVLESSDICSGSSEYQKASQNGVQIS